MVRMKTSEMRLSIFLTVLYLTINMKNTLKTIQYIFKVFCVFYMMLYKLKNSAKLPPQNTRNGISGALDQ